MNYSSNQWNEISSRDEFYFNITELLRTLPFQQRMGVMGGQQQQRQGPGGYRNNNNNGGAGGQGGQFNNQRRNNSQAARWLQQPGWSDASAATLQQPARYAAAPSSV